MGGANASASGSRKPSAGSRRSAARNAPSFAAVSASDGPSPSQPPPTILLGCRSFWRPRLESPGQLPTDRPLAHRRVRSLGSSSSRSERPGDADDHRARRRNRLRRLGGRSRSRIRPRLDRFPLGRMREKAMRSRAKEPPNCSTTGRSRSNSPTETATKPSSKQNETLLQQPASSPSGVVITHQNLMHHLGALHKSCGYGGGVTITWMPHFHDYGLVQGLLQPLFSGDPCYFMSPLSFLKRPSHWLGAITKYGGTHSQAPNFAYEHCIRRISPEERAGLNLATWKAAGNAAEPINPEVLEKFIETFEPCGFRRAASAPAYGLAEATLLVSSTRLNAGPRILELDADAVFDGRVVPVGSGRAGRRIVSCGTLVGDTKVAIVNPENLTKCRADEIGEIWVSDPAVAAGYWNQPTKSQEIFGAYLKDTGEGPWLRTGDLGFLQNA